MRVEANSSGLSSKWRPIWGIVSAAAFFVVCCLCCWLGFIAVSSGNINALNMIPQLITAFAALFSIPGAILGVASWHRGKEKRIQAGEQSAESVAQKLSKKWFG
jgi:TRAP-type C4-dicarboxylate transport system permease small subunit